MSASVAVCEQVQLDWFATRATLLGGATGTDGPLTVTGGPDGLNIMFPTVLEPAPVARVVALARERNLSIVGAWLNADVDPSVLADAGFERGWDPWWMARSLADLAPTDDPRVRLQRETHDYSGEYACYGEQLAITRAEPQRSWYAAAYDGDRFAGRAWAHLVGDVAGVFDMDVWPRFQRRGLGTALLNRVLSAARAAGACEAVLNATPEGAELYAARGFARVGTGRTWWLHLTA